MAEISIEQALSKGRRQLFWMPMTLFFVFLFGGIAVLTISAIAATVLFISSFIIPWVWWSFKVTKWKIWAFTNVADVRTLEKKAITQQLIWPHGNWFEKTEIKNSGERLLLEQLYLKIETSTAKKESVVDNSLPIEMTISYPQWSFIVYVALTMGGIWLIFDELVYGILAICIGTWLSFDLLRKIRKRKFFMKLSHTGITLPEKFLPWAEIIDYHIERIGYGQSTSFNLIINGEDFLLALSLSDINENAFTVERYLDIYKTRYETINQIVKA